MYFCHKSINQNLLIFPITRALPTRARTVVSRHNRELIVTAGQCGPALPPPALIGFLPRYHNKYTRNKSKFILSNLFLCFLYRENKANVFVYGTGLKKHLNIHTRCGKNYRCCPQPKPKLCRALLSKTTTNTHQSTHSPPTTG